MIIPRLGCYCHTLQQIIQMSRRSGGHSRRGESIVFGGGHGAASRRGALEQSIHTNKNGLYSFEGFDLWKIRVYCLKSSSESIREDRAKVWVLGEKTSRLFVKRDMSSVY